MISVALYSRALSIVVAAAFLAGCGGTQSGGTMPMDNAAPRQKKTDGHEWMRPEATSDDLIYATGGCGGTCVLSYPSGKLVGTLNVGDAGACADKSGNVFIANQGNLFEFAHGGTTPINTYTVPNAEVAGCSIDPTSGNVATTVNVNQSSNYNVAIFSNTASAPTTYSIPTGAVYCGYDDKGNLFVDGPGSQVMLDELPKGSSGFVALSIHPSLLVRPGQVQWDGSYLALEGLGARYGVKVYRLKLSGSSATVVQTIKFRGVKRSALQSWIEGSRIIIPYGKLGDGPRKTRIGIWKYPRGRTALQVIAGFSQGLDLQAVTFSFTSLESPHPDSWR